MKTEAHPQVTAVMEEFRRFNDVLEAQVNRKTTESFTATDEAETVEVTIDGESCLTGLHIEDGLLRLGADTVERRINEALRSAQAEALANINAQAEQTAKSLSEILSSLQNIISGSTPEKRR